MICCVLSWFIHKNKKMPKTKTENKKHPPQKNKQTKTKQKTKTQNKTDLLHTFLLLF